VLYGVHKKGEFAGEVSTTSLKEQIQKQDIEMKEKENLGK